MSTHPLEPLYAPWEEPNLHRAKNPNGGSALVQPGRRRSRCRLVPHLRAQVDNWRHSQYAGATDTTKALLRYWFDTAHKNDFRYHFAQREAVETVIWLYEIAQYRSLGSLFASLIPDTDADYAVMVNSVPDEEDQWARYCTKLATGGGKTKCMSLLVAWSYFNSIYENEVEFARHFVVVAPNLIVFDRLREDFANVDGEVSVFHRDPVLPPEFAEDFSLQVVTQDDAGGGAYRGALYLTNIHRLYDKKDSTASAVKQPPSWAGPEVKAAQVFKTGERLRDRITSHPLVMILNDEAHHLHDEDLAWPKAIEAINRQSRSKGNSGVMAQLDFTATPKHNDGKLFRHIVSDFPLGEAVDAGIVKVPVIGKSDELTRFTTANNAFEEYRNHLLLGYKQYESYFEEWKGSNKPVLFVMTENAQKADEIAAQLNTDDRFPLLQGKVLNLHTRLKGKIVKKKQGGRELLEFVPSEKGISDEDLKVLRDLSKQLDEPESPYRCVVSVLMLREGWDVRNVTTIVPLRPFTAASNILPEQTLGRGLRRMTRPGDALERVTVVEHSAFIKFYKDELEQEGLDIHVDDLVDPPKPQTVTIFVDHKKKIDELEIVIPTITDSIQTISNLEVIQFEEIRDSFARRFKPLPIREPKAGTIHFEERTLFTDEVVRKFELDRGLLQMGSTSISVYAREIEKVCRLQNSFAVLAPLLEQFVQDVLFERPVNLYSGEVDHRMGDIDVAEHIRATFVPLIRSATILEQKRKSISKGGNVSEWRNFQATTSERRPCVKANKTLFNLVPCGSLFEAEFADFLDECDDVAAFIKSAGPQKVMIDFLAPSGRPAIYWPDFVVRLKNGEYLLVETKGQTDDAAGLQARAAVEWCKTASKSGEKWTYVFVSVPLFEGNNDFSMEALARACAPKLHSLIDSLKTRQTELPFDATPEEVKQERKEEFLGDIDTTALSPRIASAVEEAITILAYSKRMGHSRFGAAFQTLLEPLETLCGAILKQEMLPYVPQDRDEQHYYFKPHLTDLPKALESELMKHTINLKKNLVFDAHNNRIGNLLFCLSFGSSERFAKYTIGGVWQDVAEAFSGPEHLKLIPILNEMNDFRNHYVVHGEEPLTDLKIAEKAMVQWVAGLVALQKALA
jgi:type III restriction enzyme